MRFVPVFLFFVTLAMPAAARPIVAVIDSGVARTAELAPVLIGEVDMDGHRPAFQPRYDHGTMVATILTREAAGAVDILSYRIDDPAGCPEGRTPPCQPSVKPIVRAIADAAARGVTAINLSLTMAEHPAIVNAVRDAARQGVIVVMAAGNAGRDRPDNLAMAKAGFPRAVLVGAVDADGRPWTGSNRPDGRSGADYVWRLGVAVPTMVANGRETRATGTSFATPIETARRVLAAAAPPEMAALDAAMP